jgi:hypothetical protein
MFKFSYYALISVQTYNQHAHSNSFHFTLCKPKDSTMQVACCAYTCTFFEAISAVCCACSHTQCYNVIGCSIGHAVHIGRHKAS